MYPSFNARALGLPLSARESIELAARAGFGGVDLLVRDLVEAGEDPVELRRRMDDLGLRGGAWPLPVDWRRDAGRFAQDLERLPRFAEVATALGLVGTGTWIMPGWADPDVAPPSAELVPRTTIEGPGEDRASGASVLRPRLKPFAFHLGRLTRIVEILATSGQRLGLEVIGVESARAGGLAPFIHRMDDPELGRLIRCLRLRTPKDLRCGLPAVGILLDAFHLHAAGESVEPTLDRWTVRDLVWVHVADVPRDFSGGRSEIRDDDRGLPGERGEVDAAGLLARLQERGYPGPVTAEPMAGCRSLAGKSIDRMARDAAAALRRVWPVGRG